MIEDTGALSDWLPRQTAPEPGSPEDRIYLEERAEAEIALAQASLHPAVVRAHYLLAGFYLDRLHGPGARTEEGAGAGASQGGS